MNLISFVIPCYRSEKYIGNVLNEIISTVALPENAIDYEIICVDDCSPDNVYEVLKNRAYENNKIKVIHMAKNCGQHSAIMAGLRVAKGDVIVTLDDDGQCPVDHVFELLAPLNDDWDVSIAKYPEKKQGTVKNLGSVMNTALLGWLTDKPDEISVSNFFAIKKFVVKKILEYEGPYPTLGSLLFRTTKKIINVEMDERERITGNTTYTIGKLVGLLFSNILGFTIKPLRVASFAGMGFSAAGIIYAIVLIIRKIIHPEIPMGYSSIMVGIFVVGGLNLLFMGILGEYIGRMYMTQNKTPQYTVKETINIDEENDEG